MYEYLRGKVEIKSKNMVSVDVEGVGYRVMCSERTINSFEDLKDYKVFIHMYVREDAMNLYGFHKEEERDIFRLLISVSGIGTKLGLDILSSYDLNQLITLIRNEDINHLTKIPGLGVKKAQKMVIEIKDKMPEVKNMNLDLEMKDNIILGLQALGYSKKEITDRTKNFDFNYSSIQEGIREILMLFSSQ